jgi:hypothetical protein
MPDYDLPPVPNYQLQTQFAGPAYQPPSVGFGLPPLTLGGGLLGPGGGSPASLTTAFGHLTDPPAPNFFGPSPVVPPLQLNGLGPLSSTINPWLANPMGVAGDAQREMDMLPRIDPGLAAQQTIFHAPTIRW